MHAQAHMTQTHMADKLLSQQPIIGRFAPSPTGHLHLGNIASMLIAWLAARLNHGRIVLRIEDIDQPRTVKDADQWIMEDLHWLGLDWDGEPNWQSKRLDIYEQALHRIEKLHLLGSDGKESDERAVFSCFCSRKELREASAPQDSDGFFIYPGTCRHYASSDSAALSHLLSSHRHSLRLAMPQEGVPGAQQSFCDACYGPQSWNLPRDVGDVVIRRSDGLFAYQLVVVIDDYLQGVNQIVRGRDLLRSTAIQMWIRRCLLAAQADQSCVQQFTAPVVTNAEGFETPENERESNRAENHVSSADSVNPTAQAPLYLHTPLILDTDGTRLAKRRDSLEIATLRERGVPAEAIIGYLAAILGLTDSTNADRSDFEPLSPADLCELLTPETLVARLRGNAARSSQTPRDHVVNPDVLTRAEESQFQSRSQSGVIHRKLTLYGRVQGVGMRWFAVTRASHLSLDGWVRNCADGSVDMEFQGSRTAVETMTDLMHRGAPYSRVTRIDQQELPVDERLRGRGFTVRSDRW